MTSPISGGPLDDHEAVRRMKAGDIVGLESLVRRYQVRAVRVAFLVTQDEPLAEDVVQDVFLRLYRRIRSFDEGRPLEPYLMRSAVNGALNAVRRERKSTSLEEDAAPLDLRLQTASAETEAEVAEQAREILGALARLAPRQRAAIVQRYYLELSEQEMAQALDAPPGTVKWLLHAARLRLRSLLGSGRSTP
jgi:RNA polymerase sigma-70 factor (ECF subfamily)